jgi:hypothetical protein
VETATKYDNSTIAELMNIYRLLANRKLNPGVGGTKIGEVLVRRFLQSTEYPDCIYIQMKYLNKITNFKIVDKTDENSLDQN